MSLRFANATMKPVRFVGVAAALALALPARAELPSPPPETQSIPVVLLVDFGSGQTLYAKQPDKRFLPASMTKVMTAFVAFEEMRDGRLSRDKRIAVREDTAREWNGKGTSMYLHGGEHVSVDNLLHGIMTASANDASVVLAQGHAGSVPVWTAMMNQSARKLGMTNSHFATPNGWPDEGKTYVTARNLVQLASALIRNFPEEYARYSGKTSFKWNDRMLYSHDPVSGVIEGADGIKTGFTREAGYNFLGSASRHGRRLIMVTGGARTAAQRLEAARTLLEWGFSEWKARPLFEGGGTIAQVQVQGGTASSVPVAAKSAVYAAIPRSGDGPIRLHLRYTGPVAAPVAAGQRVAELEIRVGDMPAGRVPLVATRAVAKGGALDRLVNGFKSLLS